MNSYIPLIQELNILLENLDIKYDINSGGCCYVAYLVARNLEKLHIPYCLNIDCGCSKHLYSANSRETILAGNTGKSAEHYYIRCYNKDINIGITNNSDYIVSISSRFLSSSNILKIYEEGSWNCLYNISNNKLIKNKIYEFFRKKCRCKQ